MAGTIGEGGAVAGDEKSGNILHVKKNSETGFHFHYSREERLKLQEAQRDPKAAAQRRRFLKFGKWLYIILGLAIAVMIGLFLFKFFFQ